MLSLLKPQRLIRLNEHILYAQESVPVVSGGSGKQRIDPRQILQSLQLVQQALKQDIVTSAVLPTPEQLQREFGLDPRACLFGIEPLAQLKSSRGGNWAPILFVHDGVPKVGWQRKGMLRAVLGIDFSDDLNAWLGKPSQLSPDAAPGASPTDVPARGIDVAPLAAAASRRSPEKKGRPDGAKTGPRTGGKKRHPRAP
ncbi:MAG: hypothetical protein WDM84_06215 [Bauldia sp.]